MSEVGVRFEDVVPYEVPESLDALHGPSRGSVVLPLHLWWSPGGTFGLSDRDDVLTVYRVVVREGRVIDQQMLLDRGLLLGTWSDLRLPLRCRERWESTFAELRR